MTTKQETTIKYLYIELYDRLFAYARSALDNNAIAEEAVHEAFQIACSKPQQLCTSPNPRGWMVQTLKYVISNMRRRQATANRIYNACTGFQDSDLDATQSAVDVSLLYENISHTEEFILIRKMALDGKSIPDLAEEYNISISACNKRVQRAKKILQKKLKINVPKSDLDT